MSDLLTAEELARRLRLRPSTVKRWAQAGIIPVLRLTSRVVRFDPDQVDRVLRERADQNDHPHIKPKERS